MSTQRVRNIFSTGRLIQANSHEGVAISTDYDLRPGETRIGVVRIANADSVPRHLRLFELDASSDFGAGELNLEIADAGGASPVVLFSGAIGAVPREGIDLGSFEAAEERTYCLTLTCSPGAVGSSLDRVAGAAYEWRGDPEGMGEVALESVGGSGGLLRASSSCGAVLVAGPDLKPGESRNGEVTIVNLGTRPAVFRIYERSAGTGFAAGRLGLTIHELSGGGVGRLHLGEIGGLPDEGVDLGRFEPGESRNYRFTVLLSKDTPEEEIGRAAGAAYDWLATPVEGR